MPKSVAIIGTRGYPSYYGGFETAVRRLAPFLVDEGWSVTVYGRKQAIKTDEREIDSRVNSTLTPGIELRSLSTLSYGLTASIHAAAARPDVALVMNVGCGYFLPLLRARGIPTLMNVDGIEWERAKWGTLAKNVFRGGAKMTAATATNLVFDAQEIGRRWKADFGRDGVYIPYGGDFVGDLPVEQGLSRRRYVLFVARFVPENSFDVFLDAAALLAGETPIVIVGSSGYGGNLDEQVARLAAEHANIHWLGHINDQNRLLSLWQHAGAYFHGHSVGGTNPALVQAMACGAPIVARDTPYNREVLGASAGIFTQPVAEEIASAVRRVLTDHRMQDRLSTEAQKRAGAQFTWRQVCQQYSDALDELRVGVKV